jgi:tetratricopeptide (TPR) repeat protein
VRALVVAAALLVALAPSARADGGDDRVEVAQLTPGDQLDAARVDFKAKKYFEARKALKDLLLPKPRLSDTNDLAEAYLMYGVCLLENGETEEAGKAMEDSLGLNPARQNLDPQYYSSKARTFFQETRAKVEQQRIAIEKAKDAARQREIIENIRKNTKVYEQRPYFVNFVPGGAGQFQNGHRTKGILFASGQAVAGGTSLAIWLYLVGNYGISGTTSDRDEAATILRLQQVEVVGGVVFVGLYVWSVIDALVNYKKQVQVDVPPELLEPATNGKRKTASSSRLRLAPAPMSDGAGVVLSWEH